MDSAAHELSTSPWERSGGCWRICRRLQDPSDRDAAHCCPSSEPARDEAQIGKGPAVLRQLLLDIFFLTLLPAFHLRLQQRCTASCLLPIAE